MASALKVQIQGNKASLSGTLDEHALLSTLEPLTGPVVINWKGVNRLNSCGVRDWIILTRKLKGATLTYEECPMVVIKQLNAVPDFQAKAKVSSFFAPYFCEDCDQESLALLQTAQVKDGVAPAVACQTCKKPMNFDAIPNQYFGFMKRA